MTSHYTKVKPQSIVSQQIAALKIFLFWEFQCVCYLALHFVKWLKKLQILPIRLLLIPLQIVVQSSLKNGVYRLPIISTHGPHTVRIFPPNAAAEINHVLSVPRFIGLSLRSCYHADLTPISCFILYHVLSLWDSVHLAQISIVNLVHRVYLQYTIR